MRLKIIQIDDSRVDATIAQHQLVAGMYDLELVHRLEPFDDPACYDEFDGVLVDLYLRNANGVDVAHAIKAHNWRKPIMLLTGADPGSPYLRGAYRSCMFIGYKSQPVESKEKFRHFVSVCAALKTAN